jgi:hypothetical protein
MFGPFLILVLFLALIAAVPAWPHSRNWGYYPTGGVGLTLVVVGALVFMGCL